MANGLALSPSTNFCEERVREEAISPMEFVSVDVEGDGRGDRLTREAGSMRWSGSLTTLGTRSGSAGRSLVVRRGDGGRFPMEHAEDVVHMRRRIVKGHDRIGVVLVGVAEWGMMGTCQPMSSPYMFPTSAQQYSIIPTAPICHHRPPLYQQRPYAPMSIQRLSSIPGDCFRSIKPSTLSPVQAQPISI